MYIVSSLEEQIMREIDAVGKTARLQGIILGGVSGSGGGAGGPPGGFIGQLAQKYVAFDTTESTDISIPSDASLLTNLNRIRGGEALGDGVIQQRHLASGISIPTITAIEVEDEDEFYNNINNIKFVNAEVDLSDLNQVTVTVPTITNNYYDIPSGVGTRFQNFVWNIDGTLSSGIAGDHVYKFNDPYYVSKVSMLAEVVGSSDTTINLQGSFDGETWTDLLESDLTIGSGDYYVENTISGIILNSGILVRSIVKTAGNLEGLDVILEGTVNMLTMGGGGSLGDLTPLRVVISDSLGTGTTSEKLKFDGEGKLDISSESDTLSPKVVLNKKLLSSDPLLLGTDLGGVEAGGFDGVIATDATSRAYFVTTEDWSETSHGTAFIVDTTPIGSTTIQQSMILTDDGDLSITGDLFSQRALITELYVGAQDLNTSLAGRTRNITVIDEKVEGTPSTGALTFAVFNDSTVQTSTVASLHARGTRHVPTPTQIGDVVGRFTGRGYWGGGGNDYAQSSRSRMDFVSTDNYTNTAQGGKIEFYTTPSGTDATALATTIHDNGVTEVNALKLNQTSVSGYVLTAIDTNGNLELLPSTGSGGIEEAPINGNLYARKDATWEVITPSGISPNRSYWNPLVKPNSGSSYDDEFDDSSYDTGKWSLWDVGGVIDSVTETPEGLVITSAIEPPGNIGGVYQLAPTPPFTVWTQLNVSYNYYMETGLFISEDLDDPEVSQSYTHSYMGLPTYGHGLLVNRWNDYQSRDTPDIFYDGSRYLQTSLWLRMRVDTDIYFDISTDGVGWVNLISDPRPFVIKHFGMFMYSSEIYNPVKAVYSFFRVTNSADFNQVMGGNRVGVINI